MNPPAALSMGLALSLTLQFAGVVQPVSSLTYYHDMLRIIRILVRLSNERITGGAAISLSCLSYIKV